jgi:hypothetical protein
MKMIVIIAAAALTACAPQAGEPPANEAAATPARSAPAETTTTPAASNGSSPAPARTASLTAEGWGPLRIGMARSEVEAALGADADPGAVGGPDPEACDQFKPERAPEGMLLMLEKGKLTRISLGRGADMATDRGIRLGDGAAKVRTAYGADLRRTPHAYLDPEGEYLTAWARGGGDSEVRDPAARGVRYEIGADDRVTAIHAGGPAIQYVEGCL